MFLCVCLYEHLCAYLCVYVWPFRQRGAIGFPQLVFFFFSFHSCLTRFSFFLFPFVNSVVWLFLFHVLYSITLLDTWAVQCQTPRSSSRHSPMTMPQATTTGLHHCHHLLPLFLLFLMSRQSQRMTRIKILSLLARLHRQLPLLPPTVAQQTNNNANDHFQLSRTMMTWP